MPDSSTADARRWAFWALAIAALFWVFDLALLRAGTPDPLDDLWEYGVAARVLLAGDGFRTAVIHPPLWALRDSALTVPVLIHGPLVPMLIAPLVAVFGVHALDSMAWLAAVCAWLSAALILRIGARRWGAPVGAAAALLFTLSPLTLRAVHHDMALLVGSLLLLCALDLLTRPGPRMLAAGVALGLAYLARPEMLIAAPLFALAARRGALHVLFGFALAAAPWWVHLLRATGNPFFNLSSYLLVGYWSYPELSPLRDFSLTPARWPDVLRELLPNLPRKWVALAPHALKRALLTPTGATGWLALVGAAVGLMRGPDRGVTLLAIGLASIPVAIQIVTLYDSRYLVPFLPLWALAAARGAEFLASHATYWARRPRAWLGALLLLVLPSVLPAMQDAAREARALRARLSAERGALATHAARGGQHQPPMISDTPDFVAFSTGRSVIWLTAQEAARLPAPGESNPGALPTRPDTSDTWFGRGTAAGDVP